MTETTDEKYLSELSARVMDALADFPAPERLAGLRLDVRPDGSFATMSYFDGEPESIRKSERVPPGA